MFTNSFLSMVPLIVPLSRIRTVCRNAAVPFPLNAITNTLPSTSVIPQTIQQGVIIKDSYIWAY